MQRLSMAIFLVWQFSSGVVQTCMHAYCDCCIHFIHNQVLALSCSPDPLSVPFVPPGSSAFCMHILHLKRTGVGAAKAMPHMLVTTPGGPVVHVTESFATLLGTTPKVRSKILLGVTVG